MLYASVNEGSDVYKRQEMVIAQQIVGGQNANVMHTIGLKHTKTEGSRVTYALDYTPDEAGTFDVALRIFPVNPHLPLSLIHI